MPADQRLWGSNFTPEEVAEAKRHGRILSLELEFSRECNLRCVYCYASSGKKLHSELTLEEILDALDQAIALGARRIILLGGGEPMLYPHAWTVMRHLHQRGVAMDLFTNGTLVTPEAAAELFGLGVAPVVKMNSRDEAVQDALAGVPGAFRAIQAGLANLMAAGYPAAERPLGVETIICRQNLAELPDLWVWARDRNIIPYVEMITFQGRARQNAHLNVSAAELHDLFVRLAALDRERYGLVWEPHPPIAALRCNRHEYSCTINSRGYVQPCTGVDLTVGSIRHASLADILRTSPVIQALRDVRHRLKGACGQCDQRAECYGCRGLAYHITGDFLEADPLCWHHPKPLS